MMININNHRIDPDNIHRYVPTFYSQKAGGGYITVYFKMQDYVQIMFADTNELNVVLTYLDKYFDVKHLRFVPERETGKLIIENAN